MQREKRWLIASIAVVSTILLMQSTADAARPPAQTYGRVHFYPLIMPNLTAEVAVITFGFNVNITLQGGGIKSALPDLQGCIPTYSTVDNTLLQTVPKLLPFSTVAYMECEALDGSTLTFPAMTQAQLLGTGGALPLGLMLIHPTADPAVSVSSMLGGLTYTHLEWFQDQLSWAIIMNGTQIVNGVSTPFTNQNLDVWQLTRPGGCWIKLGNRDQPADNQNTKTVLNEATSDALPAGEYYFNQTDMRCTEPCVERMRIGGIFHGSYALNMTTPEQFRQWLRSAHSHSLYECFLGCSSFADTLYTASIDSAKRNNTIGCVFKEGTDDFNNDPCCNDDLALTQLCLPRTVNVTLHPINEFHIPSNIKGNSVKENLLRLALNSYVGEKRFAEFDIFQDSLTARSTDLQFDDVEAEYNAIYGELLPCVNEVQYYLNRRNTDCHQDTDCPLSYSCDINIAGGKTCKKPNESDAQKALVACLLRHNNQEVVRAFQVLRGHPADPANALDNGIASLGQSFGPRTTVLLADVIKSSPLHFIPAIQNLTQPDCAGPHSAPCRSNYTVVCDAMGNLQVSEIPANATCCALVGQQCNWNARAVTSQSACTSAPTTDHFCGIRDGSSQDYTEIGHPFKCISTEYNDPNSCGNAGLTWYVEPNGYGACMRSEGSLGACLGTSGSVPLCTDHETNIAAAVAAGTYRSDDPLLTQDIYCGTTMCYATSLTASQCTALTSLSTPQWTGQADMLKIKNGIVPMTPPATGFSGSVTAICVALIHHKQPVSAQNDHVCQDMNGNFSLPQGTFVIHHGRAARPAQWDGHDSCLSVGRCRAPGMDQFGTTQTSCEAATTCPHSCSRCVSPRFDRTGQVEKGLCYDPTALADNACKSPGVWRNYTTTPALLGGSPQNHAVCEIPAESAAACAVVSTRAGRSGVTAFQFVSCGDTAIATQALCTQAGTSNSYTFSWMYKALQCTWDTHQACRTTAECNAEQRCDDNELDLCNCVPGLLCTCQGGACIDSGATCLLGNANLRQTKLGCMDMSIASSTACAAKQVATPDSWAWVAKAYTQADCLAHGNACKALSSYDQHPGDDISGRVNADCINGGGGNLTNHYNWLVGSFDSAGDLTITTDSAKANVPRLPQQLKASIAQKTQYQTTQWVPRAWGPSGTFTDTIGASAAQQFVAQLTSHIVVTKLQRRITQHFGRFIPVMSILAAANNTDDGGSGTVGNVIWTHHPYVYGSPNAQVNYMKEQTALIHMPGCVTDPFCTPGTIPGTPFAKACGICQITSYCTDEDGNIIQTEDKILELTKAIVDATESGQFSFLLCGSNRKGQILPVCTCTRAFDTIPPQVCVDLPNGAKSCVGGLRTPDAARCGCVNDAGDSVSSGYIAQPFGAKNLVNTLHTAFTLSTIPSAVVAAYPEKAAQGGTECATIDQLVTQCQAILTPCDVNGVPFQLHADAFCLITGCAVSDATNSCILNDGPTCAALVDEYNTCIAASPQTVHVGMGTQVLAAVGNFFTSVGATARPYIPSVFAITFTDQPVADLLQGNYNIIKNDAGRVVGQIIGDCIAVGSDGSGVGGQFPVMLSAPVDPLITPLFALGYIQYDFCGSTNAWGPPLMIPVSLASNGTNLVGSINNVGLYCPCVHEVNWTVNPLNRISDQTLGIVMGILVGVLAGAALGLGITSGACSGGIKYTQIGTK